MRRLVQLGREIFVGRDNQNVSTLGRRCCAEIAGRLPAFLTAKLASEAFHLFYFLPASQNGASESKSQAGRKMPAILFDDFQGLHI